MISEADLIRLINWVEPYVNSIQATLGDNQYLSPQGIFLAIALKWFDEMGVNVAIIEVGRGGRFDDNALVPNKLSLFTPILLEHIRYLGNTIERIAWHKAGIIKSQGYAFSVPQLPEVMDVLRKEADVKDATFEWLAPMDMGQLIKETENGQRISLGRYGEIDLPLYGRYEIENVSLAVWGAGNIHARLKPTITHGDTKYVERIRHALENLTIPGRCQKLQDKPAVFIDGAMNIKSARIFIESVKNRVTKPLITILAIAKDRDYPAIYQLFADISDKLIITQTERNIAISFVEEDQALATARQFHTDVEYVPSVAQAIRMAINHAGTDGTVLMSVGQPAIGDVMAYYGYMFEEI